MCRATPAADSPLPPKKLSKKETDAADSPLPPKKLCKKEADPEVEAHTRWVGLLDDTPPAAAVHALPVAAQKHYGSSTMVHIEGLLSEEECVRLNAAAETIGFGRTNYPQSYRGNLRLIVTDPGLAAALWERLRTFAPKEIEARDYEGGHAVWRAVGLNERFRLAKYHAGARFGAHVDANFGRNNDEMSLLTVNVYTNTVAPEHGGNTRFYAAGAAHRVTPGERHVDLAVRPQAGTAMLFLQNPQPDAPLHDGEVLTGA